MSDKTKEEIQSMFKEAVDNNVIIYDAGAPTGIFTAELMKLIRYVGEENGWGYLISTWVGTDIKIERPYYGKLEYIGALWCRPGAVFNARDYSIYRTKFMSNGPNMDKMIKETDCSNAQYKKHYGIIRFSNRLSLCGV